MFVSISLTLLLVLNIISTTISQNVECSTPSGAVGHCKSIYSCPSLLEILNKPQLTASERTLLQKAQCSDGEGDFPHVCCSDGLTARSSFGSDASSLPQLRNCGTQPTTVKIIGGNRTSIGEFTWMALFEYTYANGGKGFHCAGSLINQRYVLTAAHCINKIPDGIRLTGIRLGENDISQNIDCDVRDDCADPVVDVGVEETIVHPSYDKNSRDQLNDIALVRLNRDIRYTSFIRPVCLPSANNLRSSPVNKVLTVAGWGQTETRSASVLKLKVSVPVVDQTSCAEQFATKNVRIKNSQVCAGGQRGYDSCRGDSGGPLMVLEDQRWYIEGIVSFGNKCGEEGWPGIYTRVASYDRWIKQNMRR